MPVDPTSVPDFDDLPKVEGMPQGCAWGVFDQDGTKDKVGTLNFLTPDIVLAAAREVQHGVSISLNWPLNANKEGFRKAPTHNFIHLPDTISWLKERPHCWDDEISFNTQYSSQWDSLCHIHNVETNMAYNAATPTRENLKVQTTKDNDLPTLDHWHDNGCMVARGVLIDYKAFAEEKGIPFHAFDSVRITPADVEACAAHQGVLFKPGDVLLVRTGATEILEDPSEEDVVKIAAGSSAGLHGCEETARWIWNKRFAAVASDCPGFEAVPGADEDGKPAGGLECLVLHQYLLSSFGMSIGELWDLQKLSAYCKKTAKYSFMLTSAPLNYACLIGSPANALAIL
ncbi:hypothetical protein QQS21_001239 [Conoideocrella luteorostrata]|uniref:Cyclase n=1 Tax=Conoideocrella luteorostrata TaxID=1105319 RepID=A0AAJ0D0X8_9HYPO|nr:hypothetical protein QQS21_001239 [Conoideocrella luteorostrata]